MKKRILFVLLTLVIIVGALSGCNNNKKTTNNDGDYIFYEPGYYTHRLDEFIKHLIDANNGEDVYRGEYLVLDNKHADGSECSEIIIVTPKVSYDDYYPTLIRAYQNNYQYEYLPAENYIDGIRYHEILVEFANKKDSFYLDEERSFSVIGWNGEVTHTNLWYLEHDGYLITVALPDHIVFNSEEEVRQHFTFETQILRECEVCKAATE